jgi:hypothetical protein
MGDKKKQAKGKYRVATFTFLGLIELAYILSIAYVLLVNDGDCNKPLRLWLQVLMFLYLVHFVLLSVTELITPYCTHFLSGKICAVSAALNAMLGLFMVVWFVLGNIWYFDLDASCSVDFYEGEWAAFLILVVYYVFLGSTCCLGCLMVIFICLGCGITNRAADY